MDDWMRLRSVRLLLGVALGLAACGFSMGYSALYAPATDSDATGGAPPAGSATAAAAAVAANNISVSVSVPADVAFTNIPTIDGVAGTSSAAGPDPPPAVSLARPPTRSVVNAALMADDEISVVVPVRVLPDAADPEPSDNSSVFLPPPVGLPRDLLAARPTTTDNAPPSTASGRDVLDSHAPSSARGASTGVASSASTGSGGSGLSASGTSNDGTSTGSGASLDGGSGQSSSGTQSAATGGGATSGPVGQTASDVSGAVGNVVGGTANAVGGVANGAVGAVSHAAGGVLGGGGNLLGKK
jgi:hypothetical protein